MRSVLIRLLLAGALVFAAWALWRAFAPSPTEKVAGSAAPTPRHARTAARSTPPSRNETTRAPRAETAPSPQTAEGDLRLEVAAEDVDPEALRRGLMAAGGRDLAWADGRYAVTLPANAVRALEELEGVRLLPARLPISQELRKALEEKPPYERLRVTFICASTAGRQRLEARASQMGRVELSADAATIARLRVDDIQTLLRERGADLLCADLRREAEALLEEPPARLDDEPIGAADALGPPLPLTGRGEVVALMDTGCSGGLDAVGGDNFHADLADAIHAILPQPWWALRSGGKPSRAEDASGHGTHVAGILAGDGRSSQGRRWRGVAPDAHLVIQNNAFGDTKGLLVPPDLRSVFEEAYAQGARIHSDSWGARQGGGHYTLEAWAADTFAWEHPECLLVFAAGNGGPAEGTLAGGPAAAKNVLTVGALESDGQSVAPFSSLGPAADGRPKPELFAPGVRIAAPSPPPDNGYTVLSGTSMAAPAVAGAAALVRQWLRETRGADIPSAALLRATLLLGSRPIAPDGARRALSLADALLPPDALTLFADFTYGPTGSALDLPFSQSVAGPFRAVLAWTDAPAVPGAADTQVNRLDLRLLDAEGNELPLEPIEGNLHLRLECEALPPGDYILRVESERVPMPEGSAALAIRLPDPGGLRLLHAPVRRVEPGTSEPIPLLADGAGADGLELQISEDGSCWKTLPQNNRLDAPAHGGAFHYRFTLGERLWGPFEVFAGANAELAVESDCATLACFPPRGTHRFATGEPVTATACDAWEWDLRRAGFPSVTRRVRPVQGWTLHDTASGRILAHGDGPEASFEMPGRPATLHWRVQPNP